MKLQVPKSAARCRYCVVVMLAAFCPEMQAFKKSAVASPFRRVAVASARHWAIRSCEVIDAWVLSGIVIWLLGLAVGVAAAEIAGADDAGDLFIWYEQAPKAIVEAASARAKIRLRIDPSERWTNRSHSHATLNKANSFV